MSPIALPLLVLVTAPAELRLDLGRVAAAAAEHAPRAGAARARAESARLAAALQQPSPYPDLLLGAKLWAVPPSSAISATTGSATQDALGAGGADATRYRLYAQLRLPVLRAAAARQAGEVVRAAAAEGEREAAVQRGLLLRDVGAAYVLVRAAAAAAPSSAALIDVRERQLQVARARLAAGLGTTAEVARAEEALRAARLLDEESRRTGETARARLQALSGLDLRGAQLLPPSGRPCESAAEAAGLAERRRPEVQRLEAEAARLRAQAPLAWRDHLDVTLGLGGSHGTTGTLDELNGLSAMLEIRGGLDAPLRARRQLMRDQSAARAAQLEAAAAAEQVAFEARTACDGYQRAVGQAAVLEARARAAAAEHDRLLSRREMVGAAGPEAVVEMPQLLEAEAALREAEAQLAHARAEAELGHVAALLAQGDPLTGPPAPAADKDKDDDEAAAPAVRSGTLYAAAGALPAAPRGERASTSAAPRGERAQAQAAPATTPAPARRGVRGMWVWHTRRLLGEPGAAEALRAFVKARGLSEIYLSVPRGMLDDPALRPALVALLSGLRSADVRVEALLGEATWHLPARRPEMLARIGEVTAWNRQAGPAGARFDGIHLDIEPQQLAANKGPGNLAFLPDLTASLKEARVAAEAARLTLAADLPRKVLRAGERDRAALREACPRLFLMLYEARRASDLAEAARLALGPQGAGAEVVVAVRPQDHGERLDEVLGGVAEALGREPGYAGWAVHDYDSYRKR